MTVVSTRSIDVLIDSQNGTMRSQDGGPAFFITRALTAEKVPFTLITGSVLHVEILLTPNGEQGKIPKPIQPPRKLPPISTEAMLLSTIVDEWPCMWPAFKGRQFIDVQGYVRNPASFGKKKRFAWITAKPYCIKATAEELRFIPSGLLAAQKKERLLVVTRGAQGASVYHAGKLFSVKPSRIIKRQHMIGAGDTFFAHFVAHFLRSDDASRSAEHATAQTVIFLEKTKKAP